MKTLNQTTPQGNRLVKMGFDEHAATELELYIDKDSGLYRQQTQPIIANLLRKIKAGKYDSVKAVKLWEYLMDSGAKKYAKEFASPNEWNTIFTKATRRAVAERFAAQFEMNVKAGEYAGFSAKGQSTFGGLETRQNPVRQSPVGWWAKRADAEQECQRLNYRGGGVYEVVRDGGLAARENPVELNLDDETEVTQFISMFGTMRGKQLANKLGLKGPKSAKTASALSNYAWNKYTAIQQRKNGNINTALQYEKIADRIYETLPEDVRW